MNSGAPGTGDWIAMTFSLASSSSAPTRRFTSEKVEYHSTMSGLADTIVRAFSMAFAGS